MEVEGKPIEVEAAVSDCLPVGVLLGTDVSQLPELLTQQNSGVGEPKKTMGIITRAAVQKQKDIIPINEVSREPKQRVMIIIRSKKTRVKRQIT